MKLLKLRKEKKVELKEEWMTFEYNGTTISYQKDNLYDEVAKVAQKEASISYRYDIINIGSKGADDSGEQYNNNKKCF